MAANSGANAAAVFLNGRGCSTNCGTFAAPVNFDIGYSMNALVLGDLNRDGKPDMAVAKVSDAVAVRMGNGDGTFGAQTEYAVSAGSYPVGIANGDFNRDGKLDLVVANYGDFGTNHVSILIGNGDGTFAAAVNYGVGTAPAWSVAVADLNGDGKPDLAVANYGSNNVSILLGNGDGTFAAAVNYPVGDAPFSLAIGDLNGDGKPDLAVANYFGGSVSVLLGTGSGSFLPAINTAGFFGPNSLVIADLNRDGRPDLAVANADANVLAVTGNGDGTFAAPVPYVSGANTSRGLAVADIDRDGLPDLVVGDAHGNRINVLAGKSDGTLRRRGGLGRRRGSRLGGGGGRQRRRPQRHGHREPHFVQRLRAAQPVRRHESRRGRHLDVVRCPSRWDPVAGASSYDVFRSANNGRLHADWFGGDDQLPGQRPGREHHLSLSRQGGLRRSRSRAGERDRPGDHHRLHRCDRRRRDAGTRPCT